MYFNSCARPQKSADWGNKAKTAFRKLAPAIYLAATPGSSQAARRALHTWTEKKVKREHVKQWFEGFWHPPRFHAPQETQTWQRLNSQEMLWWEQETIRCREQPKIAVVGCALLKGKLEQCEQGNYVVWKMPEPETEKRNVFYGSKTIGQAKELARGIDLQSYRDEVLLEITPPMELRQQLPLWAWWQTHLKCKVLVKMSCSHLNRWSYNKRKVWAVIGAG